MMAALADAFLNSSRKYWQSTARKTRRRYLHLDLVVKLAWSNDSKRYADGSVATGRVSHAGQVEGDDPD
jgi:hypothetical protein